MGDVPQTKQTSVSRPDDTWEDTQLVEALMSEDERTRNDAMRVIIERYRRVCYNIACRRLQNHQDVEDVLSDLWLRLYEKAHLWDSRKGSFRSWLMTVLINLATDRLRNRSCQWSHEIVAANPADFEVISTTKSSPRGGAGPHAVAEGNEFMDAFVTALRECRHHHPQLAQAVRLRHLEGMSTRETARKMKAPINSVKTWVFRGVRQLRPVLDEMGLRPEDSG